MGQSKILWVFSSIWIPLFFIIACAQRQALPPATGQERPAAEEKIAVKESWEDEWERVQREAKKEGKVVLYTIVVADIRKAIAESMKKFEIEVESMGGRGGEIAEKILRERKAGIYNIDMYISGITTVITQLKPAGILSPLEPLLVLPEIKNTKIWFRGELPFADRDKTILAYAAYPNGDIHINSDIIRAGDINSMQDLLSPRWEGKIIMDDPTVAGRGTR